MSLSKTLTKNIATKYVMVFFAVLVFSLMAPPVFAREAQTVTDWYIKDFKTTITTNQDSSLSITEDIVADAGNLFDKHGIFRVLPTQIATEKGTFKTSIQLVSITDFKGNPRKYQTITDNYAKTITWKIGEANITVNGENDYRITYTVKNAIRFGNKDFDELYWNLLGNFWDIETDHFTATIVFPDQITQANAPISYYTGSFASKSTDLATYYWTGPHSLTFVSTGTIPVRQGITASISFPKGIFTPAKLTFFEEHYDELPYLLFLIPLITFIFAFGIWQKYGKDPKMKKPIPPEFGIPENITPIQLGLVLNHGQWDNKFIAASIVDLAVKKFITIEQIEIKLLFISFKDYKISKAENYKNISSLAAAEKELLVQLLGQKSSMNLSDVKKTFYASVAVIKKLALTDVVNNGWIIKSGTTLRNTFVGIGIAMIWPGFIFLEAIFNAPAPVGAGVLSGIILVLFGLIMPKRTQKGVDLLFKIKGFELYMKQAEDYRQQFYEKENIFDKFLPYAIVFGITKQWAKKMETIYGKDFYKNYHPVWFIGSLGNFNADIFASQMNTIVAGISNSTGTASGAGGSGGAGGGGGGGGGGGW